MASNWELARSTGQCAQTGRPFAEGESYYAALFETPAGMERRDYCLEAWTGPPEGSFCHWKGRIPIREKKPATLDIDPQMLTQIFVGMEDEQSEMQQQFRFVLALLLMRKRLLRFEQANKEESGEYWQMRLLADKSLHRVLNPQLSDEQIARLSAQLTALLSGDLETVEMLGSSEGDHSTSGDDYARTPMDEPDTADATGPALG